MPIACRSKLEHGTEFCREGCPASRPDGVFRYARVETPGDLPPAEERIVDVAILDMNHGWPNLGHDSLVHAVLDAGCDLIPVLEDAGLKLRAVSFDVRRQGGIPEGPDNGRFAVYVGTGGPGHLDPRCNRSGGEGSQGIHEDPSWEAPLFRLFDAIQASPEAALLAVCHTFGVMCRWAKIARPVLRGPEKGGKSTGVLENLLTPEALRHPWFARFAEELPPSHRLRIVDNRLYDLIPENGMLQGAVPIAYETLGLGGPRGDALTMAEFARDRNRTMPRVFGVNHHPEIVDRARQRLLLDQKRERGEVTPEWVAERAEILTRSYPDENSDQRLHLTADFTLLGPLRFHIYRQVRRRAEALGVKIDLHEESILDRPVQAVLS